MKTLTRCVLLAGLGALAISLARGQGAVDSLPDDCTPADICVLTVNPPVHVVKCKDKQCKDGREFRFSGLDGFGLRPAAKRAVQSPMPRPAPKPEASPVEDPSPKAAMTATFYLEQEIHVPATGEPIAIYRVDIKAEVAADKINPIDVFRAYPSLVPISKERAALELAMKTERTPLRIFTKVLAASASAGAVVTGVRSFVRSQNLAVDSRAEAKWAAVAAGTAFLAQYAPAFASQIAGQAPTYTLPDDMLSAPFALEAGGARSYHIVARGWPPSYEPHTGVIR